MTTMLRLIFCTMLALLAGCAPGRHAPRDAATQPDAESPRASLTLAEISPEPVLEKRSPATQPLPPMQAIELYARARAALIDRQRRTAINLLEQAIKLDPHSVELHHALARAHITRRNVPSPDAIAAFEKAADINPDHVELQSELGWQHMLAGNADKALHHLRLALQTSGYSRQDDQAALVDLRLARVLQQQGYHRAALDAYERLLRRLRRPSTAMRLSPELSLLINRPDMLQLEIGQLYEKRGQYDHALAAYQLVAQQNSSNFEAQARYVRMLVRAGRSAEAGRRAIELVRQHRANTESIRLLREVHRGLGDESGAVEALRAVHRQNRDDVIILFALADTLDALGRAEQAQRVLSTAMTEARGSSNVGIVRRLFSLHEKRRDTAGAARVLIEAVAASPDNSYELADLWERLLRGSAGKSLRLGDIQPLEVAPAAQGAKHYWTARIASLWSRDALARSSLEQAVQHEPTFAPAMRERLDQILAQADQDDAHKLEQAQQLIDLVQQRADHALAAELRGRLLLHRKQPDEAVDAFAAAVEGSDPPPEAMLGYAAALRAQGSTRKFEQTLWKLASDRPGYQPAYTTLFNHYLEQNSPNQALKVLSSWLTADPDSISARLLEATVLAQSNRADAAELILLDLFGRHPDSPEVVASLSVFYRGTNRIEKLVELLEQQLEHDRTNRVIVEHLVDVYTSQNRTADASRLLDATRSAVAGDADLLYYVAGLYARIDQPKMSEQTLLEVLEIAPAHPPASNDLGYTWADQGKNLQRAEALIRTALQAEPDNQSFLDSLGWVLYKRGQFEEARQYLEQAIAPASLPDPVVLDHLGDVMYRLDEPQAARKRWEQAIERLGQMNSRRADLVGLKDQLQEKLQQLQSGGPVAVAPVAE